MVAGGLTLGHFVMFYEPVLIAGRQPPTSPYYFEDGKMQDRMQGVIWGLGLCAAGFFMARRRKASQ